jgi:hypothetical protein
MTDEVRQILGLEARMNRNHPVDLEEPATKPHAGREYMKANAVRLGREGGRKGGDARARVLTPSQRRQIARNAAKARWAARK